MLLLPLIRTDGAMLHLLHVTLNLMSYGCCQFMFVLLVTNV